MSKPWYIKDIDKLMEAMAKESITREKRLISNILCAVLAAYYGDLHFPAGQELFALADNVENFITKQRQKSIKLEKLEGQ